MTSIRLPTHAPFDLLGTVRLLQRRPTHPVERFVEGRYERMHSTDAGWVEVRVEDLGTIDRPNLRLSFPSGEPPSPISRQLYGTVRRSLGLDVNVTSFWDEARRIPELAELADRMRGMRPPRFAGLFEALACTIPFQQMSLDSGMAVLIRLIERFQPPLISHPVFPPPKFIANEPLESLTALGLSRAKARALHEAAQKVHAGAIRQEDLETLPISEAEATLEKLRGVGPWSSALILLRGYGRLDAFPPGDAGVARGLAAILGVKVQPEQWSARFGAQAGMLYFVSLGAALLRKGTIPATV